MVAAITEARSKPESRKRTSILNWQDPDIRVRNTVANKELANRPDVSRKKSIGMRRTLRRQREENPAAWAKREAKRIAAVRRYFKEQRP